MLEIFKVFSNQYQLS